MRGSGGDSILRTDVVAPPSKGQVPVEESVLFARSSGEIDNSVPTKLSEMTDSHHVFRMPIKILLSIPAPRGSSIPVIPCNLTTTINYPSRA
jgi:hypothetical protein